MINVGLLGTGFGYNVLAPAFNSNHAYYLTSVFSRNIKHAKEAKKRMGFKKYYDDWAELISESNIDLACIATPNHTHYEIAKLALKEGKHVIISAPFTMNVDEAEELARMASEQNKIGIVSHHYNFFPARRYVTRIIKEGKVGVLKSVQRTYRNSELYKVKSSHNWKYSKKFGGGLLRSLGSHDIDYLLRTVGGIHKVHNTSVVNVEKRYTENDEQFVATADDTFQMSISFHNGTSALINASAVHPGRAVNEFLFFGTEGSLLLSNDNEILFYDTEGNRERIAIPPNYQITNLPGNKESSPFYMMTESMASAIYNNTPVTPTFDEAVHIQRVLDAADQSDQEHKWVEIGTEDEMSKQHKPSAGQKIDKIYE